MDSQGSSQDKWGKQKYDSFLCLFNPFLEQTPVLGNYANSADLVQMLPYGTSDLGLHCLLTEISMENTVKMNTSTRNPLN